MVTCHPFNRAWYPKLVGTDGDGSAPSYAVVRLEPQGLGGRRGVTADHPIQGLGDVLAPAVRSSTEEQRSGRDMLTASAGLARPLVGARARTHSASVPMRYLKS